MGQRNTPPTGGKRENIWESLAVCPEEENERGLCSIRTECDIKSKQRGVLKMTCGVSGIMDSIGKRRTNGRTHMRLKVPPTRPPVRQNKRQNDARGDPLTICCQILMCHRHLLFQSPDRRRRRGQTAWICSPLEGRTGVTGWGGERGGRQTRRHPRQQKARTATRR